MKAPSPLGLSSLTPVVLRIIERLRKLGSRGRPRRPQEERKRTLAKLVELRAMPRAAGDPALLQVTLEFLPSPGTTASWRGVYLLRADLVDRRAIEGQTVLVEYLEERPGRFQVLRLVRRVSSSSEE